jgi:hypothetical protein
MLFWILLGVVIFGIISYVFQQNAEIIPMAIVAPADPDELPPEQLPAEPLLPEPLPRYWHAVQNEEGRTYYQNSKTRQTQWQRPRQR